MKLREILRRIKLLFTVEKELETNSLQLEEAEQKLEEVEQKLEDKKAELQSLKNEAIELRDFINSNFKEEFEDYDYRVKREKCYIISINGTKHIVTRTKIVEKCDFSYYKGYYNLETYRYFNPLERDDNGKGKSVYQYQYGYYDKEEYDPIHGGKKPEYEVPILEAYPELYAFLDGWIPNTYLKKIYYEINDLGQKELIKIPN